MQTVDAKPELRRRIEHDPSRPLSTQQLQAVDLLVAGDLTTQGVADALGMSRHHLWRWRSLPAFQAEYRKRLALAEQEAMDLAISRRVNRVAALDATWRKLKAEIAKKGPRADLVYALIATSTAAAKELGQWQENVTLRGQLDITEQVQVIRFTELAPRRDVPANVIEGVYAQVPTPPPAPHPTPDLAADAAPGRLDPEHSAALRRAIAERGLDPTTVLPADQVRAIYGEEHDPWTS